MNVVLLVKSLMESKLAHVLNERLVKTTFEIAPSQFKDLKQCSLDEALPKKSNTTLLEAGTKTVEATVCVVLPEFKQVRVNTDDGYRYAINANTPGIDWSTLHEEQRVQCTVTTSKLPKVVKACML